MIIKGLWYRTLPWWALLGKAHDDHDNNITYGNSYCYNDSKISTAVTTDNVIDNTPTVTAPPPIITIITTIANIIGTTLILYCY